MADFEAERARRLVVLVRAEREIAAASRAALVTLLAQIAADVLDDKAPIVAAVPDAGRNRNQITAAWVLLLSSVALPIRKLFRDRFLGTGARRRAMQAAEDTLIASTFTGLQGVPAQIYHDLDAVVSDGVHQNLSEDQIRAALRRELTPGNGEYNARLKAISDRIGRTEAIAAFNAGDEAGWREALAEQNSSGGAVKLTKRWLSTDDTRVRATHAEADGQVVGVDAFFIVGGEQALYPGDPNLSPEESVNCRCTAVYSTDAPALPIVASGGSQMTTPETGLPDGWRGPIAALDVETGDKRMLGTPPGGLKTRAYPLSLTEGHVGDGPAPIIGSIDRVWPQNGEMYGEGKLDLGGDAGAEFARQLEEGFTNSVSIHPSNVTSIIQMVLADGTVLSGQEAQDAFDEAGGMPEGSHDRMAMTDWVLAGLAAVPIPAYTQARIEPVYGYQPSEPQPGDATVVLAEGPDPIVAGVGGQIFHRAFFQAVATGPTKPIITEDGHFFGHVRLYGTCYQYGGGFGNGGTCVEPPASATNYAKFHQHSAKLDDGTYIDCGAITYGEGHESRGSLQASIRHITHVSTMAAKVLATEDEWGVWVTGEVLDSHRDHAYDILLSPLSGHWEPDADNDNYLEMCAAHIVVTAGYNPPSRIVASMADGVNPDHIQLTEFWSDRPKATAEPAVSARAAVLAAMRDVSRAERAARRIGIDPEARIARALARINP